jgi:hypothetical protein
MKLSLFVLLILLFISCKKESKSNSTLIDLTTSNLLPSQITDTLNVRLTYYQETPPFGSLGLTRYFHISGTGMHHYIDTVRYPGQFVRGELEWTFKDTNNLVSGFIRFPIETGTTKYFKIDY